MGCDFNIDNRGEPSSERRSFIHNGELRTRTSHRHSERSSFVGPPRNFTQDDIGKIIRIQACIRRFLAQRFCENVIKNPSMFLSNTMRN